MKKIVFVVVIIGLLAGAFVLRGVILGGTTQVTPNPPITADVSESLGSRPAAGGGRNDIAVPKLPEVGTEFRIDKSKYFDNNQWVVVYVVPVKEDAAEPAWLVMKRQGNEYVTVLGPGTSFPKSVLSEQEIPADVTAYLKEVGVLGEAVF
jgi:hypothetical protein